MRKQDTGKQFQREGVRGKELEVKIFIGIYWIFIGISFELRKIRDGGKAGYG